MKRIVAIVILIVGAAINTQGQGIGYLISIEDKEQKNTEYFKTQCTETLQESVLLYTGVDIDIEKLLAGDNVFFELRMNDVNYYVEKKLIVERKSGKKVYRKITKKERKELAESSE
jgi:hypothetical protein